MTPDESTEQVQEAQVPTAEPTTPVQAAPAVQGGTGPWANDLNQRFADENIRGQVDAFLRETVQPYVTNLEQERSGQAEAAELLKQLEDSPVETYLAITQELFDDDQANAIINAITGQQEYEAQEPQDFDPYADQPPVRDEDTEQMLQWFKDKQQKEDYDAELSRVKEAHPDVVTELLHPFIVSADGDFDAGVELYREWESKRSAQDIPNLTADDIPNPPQTLGSEGAAGATTPPVEVKHQSLDSAIDAFLDEQRHPPQVVGSV
jgi:hypothetical protein